MSEIMVSIFCITYNHVNYICDALEGFVFQKTKFPFEVIIYDDASNDGTSDIVKEYEKKYPGLIHAIIAEKNMFYYPEREEILLNIERRYCKGKYIAYCEGDDYWLDCNKLQIQVDYMEMHPECSLYLHNALEINCVEKTLRPRNTYDGDIEKEVSAEELILLGNGHPATASFMHRKELIESPEFFRQSSVGDFTILLYALTQGKVHYSSRIMSVYRWLSEGSYNREVEKNCNKAFYFHIGLIDFLFRYDRYTNRKYHVWILCRIQIHISEMIHRCIRDKDIYEYIESCQEEGIHLRGQYLRYFDEIERIKRQTFDLTYCSGTMRDFCKKHKTVVIMGIGKYGTKVARQMIANNIDFAGFAVTKREDKNIHIDKPVWELTELANKFDDIGVVVGINPERWVSIFSSLEKAGIKNYYCPFLLDEQNIK